MKPNQKWTLSRRYLSWLFIISSRNFCTSPSSLSKLNKHDSNLLFLSNNSQQTHSEPKYTFAIRLSVMGNLYRFRLKPQTSRIHYFCCSARVLRRNCKKRGGLILCCPGARGVDNIRHSPNTLSRRKGVIVGRSEHRRRLCCPITTNNVTQLYILSVVSVWLLCHDSRLKLLYDTIVANVNSIFVERPQLNNNELNWEIKQHNLKSQ